MRNSDKFQQTTRRHAPHSHHRDNLYVTVALCRRCSLLHADNKTQADESNTR
jgi:hypothetical protein